jgi:hypothetical protein
MKRLFVIAISTLLLVPVLAGCRFSIDVNGVSIGPGTRYDVNDTKELDAQGASGVKIVTVSDDVVVKSGGGRVLAELVGECRSTTKPVWLDARAEGGSIVIEVKYPLGITNSNTMLTVTIPEGFVGDFEAGTVSGDVEAQGLPFRLGAVNLHTISGNIDFGADACTRVRAGSTSGEVTLDKLACETDVSTVSGGVDVSVPQEAAFSVDFGSVSGDFTSTHAGISVDRADGGFAADANGGGALLKVNTTSGDLRLNGR